MPRNDRPPSVTPYLTVRGGKEAIAFYKKAFGAEVGMLMMAEDKKRVMHASLLMNGVVRTVRSFSSSSGDNSPCTESSCNSSKLKTFGWL